MQKANIKGKGQKPTKNKVKGKTGAYHEEYKKQNTGEQRSSSLRVAHLAENLLFGPKIRLLVLLAFYHPMTHKATSLS